VVREKIAENNLLLSEKTDSVQGKSTREPEKMALVIFSTIVILFILASTLFDYRPLLAESSNTAGGPPINWFDKLDFVGVVGVIVTIVIYWQSEKNQLKDRLGVSYKTILAEMSSNLKGSIPHIRYTSVNNVQIDFTNANFQTDSFESIIHSGFFTYLQEDTQNKLGELYNTIKRHNATLIYQEQLIDHFLTANENLNNITDDREKQLRGKVERYDETLSKWEKKIIELTGQLKKYICEENKRVRKRWYLAKNHL
jgi:hypothetical protein